MWQDYVISGGQFVFALAMIPTIRSAQKPALLSSVITALGLSIFAVCFATLSLWLSVAGTSVGALTWWIVAAQSLKREPVKVRLDRRRVRALAIFGQNVTSCDLCGTPGLTLAADTCDLTCDAALQRMSKLELTTDANVCTCLIECDGQASLIDGETCRANLIRRWREQYAGPANAHVPVRFPFPLGLPTDDELLKGSDPTGPQPRGILNVCVKGFDVDCGLPSGHTGDCVSASKLREAGR